MKQFEPKDPAEEYAVEFGFGAVLASITSATCTVTLMSGTDQDFASLLDGDPQVTGTSVYQRVHGGVGGCTYKLRCEATDGTETYVLVSSIGVVTA